MQKLTILSQLKQSKDNDVQSEVDLKEDILRKRRDEMRSHLHVRREADVSETTAVKMIKKRREKVRKIVYNGWYDDVTDGNISSKMRDIRKLTSLTSIALNFFDCWMTDEGMRYIGDSFRHLTLLTSITLDFNWCQCITDEGTRSISDTLRYLTSLASITLNFEGCFNISDQVKNIIKQDLQKLKYLKNLAIS